MPLLRIASVNSGHVLELEPDGPEYIAARITGPIVRGSVRAWLYEDASALVEFFESMAAEWQGWITAKTWASIEGELNLEATVDRVGHVTVAIRMRSVGGPDPWELAVSLDTEAGQLAGLAREARRVFKGPA